MADRNHLDFAIIGAQKAGTTALHHKLNKHPAIAMSHPKELHIFSDDTRDWSDPASIQIGHGFRDADPNLLWGEATPIMMYWPGALERLLGHSPQVKLIVTLRHPIARALSHWRMETARGNETLSFAQAVSDVGRRRYDDVHRVFSYVDRGLYAPQVRKVLNRVPRDHVMFCTRDALLHNEGITLSSMFAFLGIDPDVPIESPKMIRPNDNAQVTADIGDVAALLRDRFDADLAEAAQLTGLDLSEWRTVLERSAP